LIREEQSHRLPAVAPFCGVSKVNDVAIRMTYKEQLLHPNWQRKRLEALSAVDFTCQGCYGKDETLHVHHKHYVKGRMAWEYDLTELAVLCEGCHEAEHMAILERDALLAQLELDGPAGIGDFFAYGAGAMPEWMASAKLAEALANVYQQKPLQFSAGRLARELAQFPDMGLTGLLRLSELLRGDIGFVDRFFDLLKEYGVQKTRPLERGESFDA
jgi:hypothetical protein